MNKTTLNSQKEKHSILSLRRATALQPSKLQGSQYFYPRSPCGERPDCPSMTVLHCNFYPRSPCGERLGSVEVVSRTWKFLSTLSLRRATRALATYWTRTAYFYPRSPCGERRAIGQLQCIHGRISIHALLAESDGRNGQNIKRRHISIHALLAESDRVTMDSYLEFIISIHALLAESDCWRCNGQSISRNFYPRSPCGERLNRNIANGERKNFYPRSPCGERLVKFSVSGSVISISIHALLAESDAGILLDLALHKYFYPRSPCGERLQAAQNRQREIVISIHALLAESDDDKY